MRYSGWFALLWVACTAALLADENEDVLKARAERDAMPKPPMTKIVVKLVSPDIPEDSYAALPKTSYSAGKTFARMEEEPDPKERIHGLLIIAEPDAWMINLYPRSGKHVVDSGPSFEIHQNIVSDPKVPKSIQKLEFGGEEKFFQDHQAESRSSQKVDGVECKVYALSLENYQLLLFLRADTGVPYLLEITDEAGKKTACHYLGYERNLPFDAALFVPPKDVQITEAKEIP